MEEDQKHNFSPPCVIYNGMLQLLMTAVMGKVFLALHSGHFISTSVCSFDWKMRFVTVAAIQRSLFGRDSIFSVFFFFLLNLVLSKLFEG